MFFSYFSVTTQNTVVIETQWTESCNYRYKWGGKYSVGTWWTKQIYPGALWLLSSTSRCLMDLGNSSRGRLTRWRWSEVWTCHWTQSSFCLLWFYLYCPWGDSLSPSTLPLSFPLWQGPKYCRLTSPWGWPWSFHPAASISWELRVPAFQHQAQFCSTDWGLNPGLPNA